MASTLPLPDLNRRIVWNRDFPARTFVSVMVSIILLASLLAGWAPVGFSIATVFLFAGPHNWFEARYLLARMPGRWGVLRPYFLTGLSGVLGLTGAFAALPWLSEWRQWSPDDWLVAVAIWNTSLVAWVTTLALLRSRQNPRRDWGWIVPMAFLLIALNWLRPMAWSLALVYLHPLIALWFMDRELGQKQPAWRVVYRRCLLLIPLCLGLLWFRLGAAPDLPGDDVLTWRIAQHAGAGVVSHVSTHFLVAAHTFLEMLHYGVWIVAIPLISIKAWPWQLRGVPLARRSAFWRMFVVGLVGVGAVLMVGLWGAFLSDYSTTRDIYFTVAMLHVLAEVPFLLRLL